MNLNTLGDPRFLNEYFPKCFIAFFLCQTGLVVGYIKHFYHLRTLSLATHLCLSASLHVKADFCFIDSFKSDENN